MLVKTSAVTVWPAWLSWITTRCAIALTMPRPRPCVALWSACSAFGAVPVQPSSVTDRATTCDETARARWKPQREAHWHVVEPLWCGCGARPAYRSRQQRTPGSSTWGFHMERVTRIELALSAWEADVLPLNYTRVRRRLPGAECSLTLPHGRSLALTPRGRCAFRGVDMGAGDRSWGVRWRSGRGSERDRSAAWRAIPFIP